MNLINSLFWFYFDRLLPFSSFNMDPSWCYKKQHTPRKAHIILKIIDFCSYFPLLSSLHYLIHKILCLLVNVSSPCPCAAALKGFLLYFNSNPIEYGPWCQDCRSANWQAFKLLMELVNCTCFPQMKMHKGLYYLLLLEDVILALWFNVV